MRHPVICCDICAPDEFMTWANEDITKMSRKKRKKKMHTVLLDIRGQTLKQAISQWRQRKLEELFDSQPTHWGTNLILTDLLAERILGLAIQGLIPDLPALEVQVNWAFTNKYGMDLLALVHEHYPPSQSLTKRPSEPRCSACR